MSTAKEQAALASTAESILGQRAQYMIVTYDTKGRLVYLEVEPDDNWLVPYAFMRYSLSPESNAVFTSKERAEKALTWARKELGLLMINRMLNGWKLNERSVEMLTVIKITSAVEAVPKRVRTAPVPDERYTDSDTDVETCKVGEHERLPIAKKIAKEPVDYYGRRS